MVNAILILAAGAASRMNQAKMLLPFGPASILSHILGEVKAVKPDCICLLTGYYHKEIADSIDTSQLFLVHNKHWKEGMASSIRTGMQALMKKHL